jgi:hypothetical protein
MMKTTVTTGAQGVASFTVAVPFQAAKLLPGGISATVTDPAGNTSELGNCVPETLDDTIFKNGFDP